MDGERYTYKVKPTIEYFQALKEFLVEHKWNQGQIIFIDDRKDNTEASVKVGIDGIQFASAAQLRDELKKRGIILENEKIRNEQTQTAQ
ncbi:hypothetical protein HYX58_05955 [Candidatus Dependentiae bacterium]|nr:hypothetical protein [Candidatus Dependentiae bacterium]